MPRCLPLLTSCLVVTLVCGCASRRDGVTVPPEALTVATVRHTSGPQPHAVWIARASLPADALRSDGQRALLLEATLRDGKVVTLESAPLELANLIVRIDEQSRRQTVVAVQNGTSESLAYDLFVSPDGERFRLVVTCPVAPHGEGYERWPERVAWIAVANVRVASASVTGCP